MLQKKNRAARIIAAMTFALCIFAVSAVLGAEPVSAVSDSAFQKSKVENLTVKMVDTTRLKITYDPCAGAKGYQIMRAPKKSGKYKLIKTLGKSKTTFKDAGRKAQTTYYYKVRAFREAGGSEIYSKYSAIKSGTTDFAGNGEEYDLSHVKRISDSPLRGLNIVFLGSSITLGKGSDNVSFVDYMAKRHGLNAVKLAKNGTTMATVQPESYIERLETYVNTGAAAPDYLVCQLSSNDARLKVDIGSIDTVADHVLSDLNKNTVSGAIEYISGYVQETWGCPVIFFVMPQYESDKFNDAHYEKMITTLYGVKDWSKWGGDRLSILDMWADKSLNNKLLKKWKLYMTDEIHPTKAGYLDIYTPAFDSFMNAAMANVIADALAEEETGETLDEGMEIQLP